MKIKAVTKEPYAAVGRQLLQVVNEPVVISSTYAITSPGPGYVPHTVVEPTFKVPTFTITNSDSSIISQQEDLEFFKLISAASSQNHSCLTLNIADLSACIWRIIGELWSCDLHIGAIVMHPRILAQLKHTSNFIQSSMSAHFFDGYNILTSTLCPQNIIYVLAKPETLGVFVVENTEECSEIIGLCITNNSAVGRIVIGNDSPRL